MGFELVQFKPGKERLFEQDVLQFASERYHCAVTRNWRVMLAHVEAADWIDLFRVSRHSAMEAGAEDWAECDAWSLTWDFLTPNGWVHAVQAQRERLVTRLELDSFDAKIARRATKSDLVTFLQDDLLCYLANLHKMPDYELHVLTHEALHSVSDWSNRQLVIDGVPPSYDKEVVATLEEFTKAVGGWPAIQQRYLI